MPDPLINQSHQEHEGGENQSPVIRDEGQIQQTDEAKAEDDEETFRIFLGIHEKASGQRQTEQEGRCLPIGQGCLQEREAVEDLRFVIDWENHPFVVLDHPLVSSGVEEPVTDEGI